MVKPQNNNLFLHIGEPVNRLLYDSGVLLPQDPFRNIQTV